MDNNFSLMPNFIDQKLAVSEIICCNQFSAPFGLALSETEAIALVNARTNTLKKVGRIEFAGGIINKLILEFCDSPFLSQFNYPETLSELIETFYFYKSETLDEISDDDLIGFMKKYFNGACQGSIDLLQTRELENLARRVRFGITNFENLSDDDPDQPNEKELDIGEEEF